MQLKSLTFILGISLATTLLAQMPHPAPTAETAKVKPFLIVSKGMPHLTMILKKNWDNKKLNLSDSQKIDLLELRLRTMNGIKDIAPTITQLENDIKTFTMRGESPHSLDEMVDELAKLKAQGTKIQIYCISNTIKILDKKQLKILLKK